MSNKGLFIALEGPDGCGKTTQGRALLNALTDMGYNAILTREPGGTPTAEKIRSILLGDDGVKDPFTELLLLSAARRDHIENFIKPHLTKGFCVISDRFIGSTLAYQGALKGLEVRQILEVHDLATGAFYPDITLVFNLGVEAALARISGRTTHNHYDSIKLESRKKIHKCYDNLGVNLPNSLVISVDSNNPQEIVTKQMLDKLEKSGMFAKI